MRPFHTRFFDRTPDPARSDTTGPLSDPTSLHPPSWTVGERIRQRRLALGLSQRDVAGPGVSYAYVSRLEANARRPSTKALRTLAPKLGVSVYWLETGRQDPAQELARLVLEHQGQPLPGEAAELARAVLSEQR